MTRAVWLALAWLLVAVPARADEVTTLVEAACDDLLTHLPATWPSHVARGPAARVRVHGLEHRSRLRDVDVANLGRVARARLASSERLRAVDETPTLVLVGGVYACAGKPWVAVLLCDVVRQTILAVGYTGQPAPEAAAALVAGLREQAAAGWPGDVPLTDAGRAVVRLEPLANRTPWRDLDTVGLRLALSVALVRSGVVELAVSSQGLAADALRAVGEAEGWRRARVGLLGVGELRGRERVELDLRWVWRLGEEALLEVRARVPFARPEPGPKPRRPPRAH